LLGISQNGGGKLVAVKAHKNPKEHMFLNAGCGTWYADGWTNVDIWEDANTKPDVVAKAGEPYPFPDNHFDAIYLGHVIEHIDWSAVPRFLLDMNRIAKPDAPILVTGPDVLKTIQLWSQGAEPWHMVLSTMEHQDVNHQPDREHEWWDGATHHWNCYHDRVAQLLRRIGFIDPVDYYEKIPNNPSQKSWVDTEDSIEWPVVGKHHWQFAIKVRAF
jgi:SAM-dependent methyltransferase